MLGDNASRARPNNTFHIAVMRRILSSRVTQLSRRSTPHYYATPSPCTPLLTQQRFFTSTITTTNEEASQQKEIEKLNNKRRQLLLNSRNRGRVETELFLGGYAQEHIWQMSQEQLEQYDKILNETDADLFLWMTGMNELPDDLKENPIMTHVLDYIKQKRNTHYNQVNAKSFTSDYEDTDLAPPLPQQTTSSSSN